MTSPSDRGTVLGESRHHQHDDRIDIKRLRDIRQLIAFIGKQTHRNISRHIHPHDHATSKLAAMFGTFIREHRGGYDLHAEDIEIGALYHDIGKYAINESIVLKPGRLTAEEKQAMDNHPVISNRLLCATGITDSRAILASVLYHHEHWDGNGYPDALLGTRIPFAARMLAEIDVFISLREEREYKPSYTVEMALAEMELMAGTVLDPCLHEDFVFFYRKHRPRLRKSHPNKNAFHRAA